MSQLVRCPHASDSRCTFSCPHVLPHYEDDVGGCYSGHCSRISSDAGKCVPCSDEQSDERRKGYAEGVKAAAEFIGSFDKQIAWPYRMEDVVLCKFNMTKRKKPRRKKW